MPCGFMDPTEDCAFDYVIRYIRSNQKIYVITIHNKTPKQLSVTSATFLQKILSEFPSLTVNTSELLSTATLESNNERLMGVKRRLYLRTQRKSLNVILIDNSRQKYAEHLFFEHIQFLVDFSLNTTRPKCLFFFVNDSSRRPRLQEFFDFAWSLKFLDVVVIELLKSSTNSRHLRDDLQCSSAILHQFNPFNNVYQESELLQVNQLFEDKLKNLHGYPLHTGMFNDIPMVMIERNYAGKDAWGMAQGLDVAITRTLAEKLNFTAELKVVYSGNSNFKRLNVSSSYMERIDGSLNKGTIDFAVNFFGMIGTKPLEDLVFETTIFVYPFSTNLIVKQYGKPVIKLSRNLMIITLVITITVVVFSIFIHLIQLDPKFWSMYNIIKILVGSPTSVNYRKVYEKILFVSLFVISSALSVNILEQLLDIYLWQDLFPELKNLQDVLKAGIVPSITQTSKRIISSYDNAALKQVLLESATIDLEDNVADCIEMLIKQKSVNGCEVRDIEFDFAINDLYILNFYR